MKFYLIKCHVTIAVEAAHQLFSPKSHFDARTFLPLRKTDRGLHE